MIETYVAYYINEEFDRYQEAEVQGLIYDVYNYDYRFENENWIGFTTHFIYGGVGPSDITHTLTYNELPFSKYIPFQSLQGSPGQSLARERYLERLYILGMLDVQATPQNNNLIATRASSTYYYQLNEEGQVNEITICDEDDFCYSNVRIEYF